MTHKYWFENLKNGSLVKVEAEDENFAYAKLAMMGYSVEEMFLDYSLIDKTPDGNEE